MPIGRQSVAAPTAVDQDTRYVPPPHAYHDPVYQQGGQRFEPAPPPPVEPAAPPASEASAPRSIGQPRHMAAIQQAQRLTEKLGRRAAGSRSRAQPRASAAVQTMPADWLIQELLLTPPSGAAIGRQRSLTPPAPVVIETPWAQQFYVYSVVLSFFTVVWLADGLFTVLGLVSLGLPVTVFGLALAVGFHLLASWGQRTLIFDPLPLLKLFGVALLSANVLSNVVGIRLALSTTAPALAGTLPLHPVEWLTGIGSWLGQLITGQEAIMPPWWPTAMILVLLAGLLAWQAERRLAEVHGRWRAICQQRPQ